MCATGRDVATLTGATGFACAGFDLADATGFAAGFFATAFLGAGLALAAGFDFGLAADLDLAAPDFLPELLFSLVLFFWPYQMVYSLLSWPS